MPMIRLCKNFTCDIITSEGNKSPSGSVVKVLHPAADNININKEIWSMYLEDLLPKLTTPEDDGNYGSASVCDVLCLQVCPSYMPQ